MTGGTPWSWALSSRTKSTRARRRESVTICAAEGPLEREARVVGRDGAQQAREVDRRGLGALEAAVEPGELDEVVREAPLAGATAACRRIVPELDRRGERDLFELQRRRSDGGGL